MRFSLSISLSIFTRNFHVQLPISTFKFSTSRQNRFRCDTRLGRKSPGRPIKSIRNAKRENLVLTVLAVYAKRCRFTKALSKFKLSNWLPYNPDRNPHLSSSHFKRSRLETVGVIQANKEQRWLSIYKTSACGRPLAFLQ